MASTLHAVNRRTNWYFGMIILKHAGSLLYTISTVRTTTYCHCEKKLWETRFCNSRCGQTHPSRDHFFHEFLKQYGGILRAMSHGEHHISAISFRTGKRESNCEAWVPLKTYWPPFSFFFLSCKFVTSETKRSEMGRGVNFSLLQTLAAKVVSVGNWPSFPFCVGKFGKYILAASDLPPEPPESLIAGYHFCWHFFDIQNIWRLVYIFIVPRIHNAGSEVSADKEPLIMIMTILTNIPCTSKKPQ